MHSCIDVRHHVGMRVKGGADIRLRVMSLTWKISKIEQRNKGGGARNKQ